MMESHSNPRRGAITILWLGDGRRSEFAPTFAALSARASVTACAGAREAESAAGELAPALVIVTQGFAGELGEADVVRLRRRYPTAALVRIVASWCEGELRSAPLVHGVKRYVAHQALPLLLADLARLERGLRPDWGLPATSTDEESLPAAIGARPKLSMESVRLGIAASDPAIERWLRDLCRSNSCLDPAIYKFQAEPGFEVGEAPSLILWDAPHLAAVAEMEFRLLKRDNAGKAAKVVALANFPRREQIAGWREAGVVEVLGKPVTDAVLLACVEQHLRRAELQAGGEVGLPA
jgi:CheY-like chemotaxis protein